MKLDILVFGAHPDDVELGCGGTVIKEIQKGKKMVSISRTARFRVASWLAGCLSIY